MILRIELIAAILEQKSPIAKLLVVAGCLLQSIHHLIHPGVFTKLVLLLQRRHQQFQLLPVGRAIQIIELIVDILEHRRKIALQQIAAGLQHSSATAQKALILLGASSTAAPARPAELFLNAAGTGAALPGSVDATLTGQHAAHRQYMIVELTS